MRYPQLKKKKLICLKGVKSAIFKIVFDAEDSGRSIRIVRFAGKQRGITVASVIVEQKETY